MKKLDEQYVIASDDKLYIKAGLLLIVIFAGLFSYWLFFTKLNSAAIAPGLVIVEGQRKAIEHLEGGIVDRVFVKEGEVVKANQPLIQLSSVSAKTRYIQLTLKHFSLLAQQERLHHERINAETLLFSEPLLLASEQYPSLQTVLQTQKLLFSARMKLRSSQLASIDAQYKGILNDKRVLKAKVKQEQVASDYLNKEVSMHDKLLNDGYSSQIKTFELKRTQARFSSSMIELQGRLQNRTMAEEEVKQNRLATEFHYISNVEQELQEINKNIDDTLELLTRAKDIL